MKAQFDTTSLSLSKSYTSDNSKLYVEGIVAGIIGAATIAIWVLILDTISGRPLYTPTLLGAALFGRGEPFSSTESVQFSLEMTLMGLVFAVIGGIASRLLGLAEQNPNLGFGILLLFPLSMSNVWHSQRVWKSLGCGKNNCESALSPSATQGVQYVSGLMQRNPTP